LRALSIDTGIDRIESTFDLHDFLFTSKDCIHAYDDNVDWT